MMNRTGMTHQDRDRWFIEEPQGEREYIRQCLPLAVGRPAAKGL
jgi:hypothetical protein